MESLYPQLVALSQIIVIDVVLAGDNAIVVGMAAARVAPEIRAKVIFWGIAGAVLLRVLFAAITVQLLAIVGLMLAGGLLLLWVCWKMYRELRRHEPKPAALGAAPALAQEQPKTGFWNALATITVADVSMSLDNVLAVAGASHGQPAWVLVVGLGIAIVLMALAASFIARLLARYPWVSWIGLTIVLYVALEMIWKGSAEVLCTQVPAEACRGGLIQSLRALIG